MLALEVGALAFLSPLAQQSVYVLAVGFMSFTWFEERHEGQTLVDDVVTKHVPPHIGLFYCLGGIVFMALVAQFTSGLVLTFYQTLQGCVQAFHSCFWLSCFTSAECI